MIQTKIDGLIDELSDGEINLTPSSEFSNNLETYRYRVKVKDGVDSINFFGLDKYIIAVSYGLDSSISRVVADGAPCGQYLTFFFKEIDNGRRLINLQGNGVSTDLGAFLSQFATVYEPLPDCFTVMGTVIIDSPDFEAKKGLYDAPPLVCDFSGSTFKTAPKIASDELMSLTPRYPFTALEGNNQPWKPFANCPNVTKIAYQGNLSDKCVYLGPCDLTFYDKDGFGKLSAYPKEAAPRVVNRYINATKVKFSEVFPTIVNKNLKECYHHFEIDEIVIDSTGGLSVPLGGIDFDGIDMDKLYLPEQKFTVNLPLQKPEQLNFSFSWATMGIIAPKSCSTDLVNLHLIFQNNSKPLKPMNIASPKYLKENVHYIWGYNIETFFNSKQGKITDDFMPLVPSGVSNLSVGHYRKIEIKELNANRTSPYFGSDKMASKLNGVDRSYKVQPLPEGMSKAVAYCNNLYANTEINDDIFIPKLPESIKEPIDCYKRTFYNAVGPIVATLPKSMKPTILIAWTETYGTMGYDHLPFNVIANADNTYNGDLADRFTKMDENAALSITYFNGTNSETDFGFDHSENWTSYSQMINSLTQMGSAIVETRQILTKIEIEKGNYNFDTSIGWQQEFGFGSGIDPTKHDVVIPMNAIREWGTFEDGMVLYTGESFQEPLGFWSGKFSYVYKTEYTADIIHPSKNYRDVHFMVMRSYSGFDRDEIDSYKYDVNSILFSGNSKTEDANDVVKPYYHFINEQAFKGDLNGFASAHGINLINQDDFKVAQGNSISDFVMFTGLGLGVNGYDTYDSNMGINQTALFKIVVSEDKINEGRYGGNTLDKKPDKQYVYNPMWIDSDAMRKKPCKEYTITDQNSLDAATMEINS